MGVGRLQHPAPITPTPHPSHPPLLCCLSSLPAPTSPTSPAMILSNPKTPLPSGIGAWQVRHRLGLLQYREEPQPPVMEMPTRVGLS